MLRHKRSAGMVPLKENRTIVQYGAGFFESAKWQQQFERVRTWPYEAYCTLLVYVCTFLVWKKGPFSTV